MYAPRRRAHRSSGARLHGWSYPACQFHAGKPRQGVARVVATARECGIDDGRLYELMSSPLGLRDGGRRLADLLVDGREDDVVAAVRAAS